MLKKRPRTPWTFSSSIWAYYGYEYEGEPESVYNNASEENKSSALSNVNYYKERIEKTEQEIDALKTQNANLQTQLNLANMQASQTAQTAKILSDNAAQTQALEQYLNPAPIPAYVVQNPNCCGQNNYGCGCGGF